MILLPGMNNAAGLEDAREGISPWNVVGRGEAGARSRVVIF